MRTTVSISPGTMLVVKLHDNEGTELDGEFAIHFDTLDYPNSLVVREMAGIPGNSWNILGEGVIYRDDYEDEDPALFDESPTRAPLPEDDPAPRDVVITRTFTFPSGVPVTLSASVLDGYQFFASRTRLGVRVKTIKQFVRQGGFEKEWGQFWFPVDGESVEDARQRALKWCEHQDSLQSSSRDESKSIHSVMQRHMRPSNVFIMPDGSSRFVDYGELSPHLYFAHHNGASMYIKESQLFADQGGFKQHWGRRWFPVSMSTLEGARAEALRLWEASNGKQE